MYHVLRFVGRPRRLERPPVGVDTSATSTRHSPTENPCSTDAPKSKSAEDGSQPRRMILIHVVPHETDAHILSLPTSPSQRNSLPPDLSIKERCEDDLLPGRLDHYTELIILAARHDFLPGRLDHDSVLHLRDNGTPLIDQRRVGLD